MAGVLVSLCLLSGCGAPQAPVAEETPEPRIEAQAPAEETLQEQIEHPLPAEASAPGVEPGEDEEEEQKMNVLISGKRYSLTLEENETAEAFRARFPLTLDMQELNGNEKYIYLDESLPSKPQAVRQIEAGDLMLFGSSCVVLFYDSFSTSYTYTRIGRLDDPEGLADAIGYGRVTVSFGAER